MLFHKNVIEISDMIKFYEKEPGRVYFSVLNERLFVTNKRLDNFLC